MKIDSIDEVRSKRERNWQQWNAMQASAEAPSSDDSSTKLKSRFEQLWPQFEKLLEQFLMQLMSQLMNQLQGGQGQGQGDGQGCHGTGGVPAMPSAPRPPSVAPPAAPPPAAAPPQALGGPPAPPSAPDAAPAPESPAQPGGVPAGNPAAPSATGAVNGGGPNSLNLRNNTDQPMQVAFFRNLAPGEHPSFNGPEATFTIGAHQSMQVAMPEDWQGRVQKWSGNTQDNSNWAEINFEKSTKKIWFDESDIPGRNSSIKITAPDGAVAGSDKSILGSAPAGIVTTDSSGQRVIKAPQWFDGKTNHDAVNFLNGALGTSNAYVLPDDNNAVRTSSANSLTVDFGDA
ncbi:MAG TPA: hypothetical protein VF169_01285 [Albitalea sp.]|uniref:hypothetical protein n=1 Tax=Piscinibacter sp. TaxID=1903157 RepID=UPI002ED1324D